jgi:hypothetical protein
MALPPKPVPTGPMQPVPTGNNSNNALNAGVPVASVPIAYGTTAAGDTVEVRSTPQFYTFLVGLQARTGGAVGINSTTINSSVVTLQTSVDNAGILASLSGLGIGQPSFPRDQLTGSDFLLLQQMQAPSAATTTSTTILLLASEALAAGALVSIFSNAGVANVRNANATDGTKTPDGFVLNAVASGAPATVQLLGQVITGLSGLSSGALYFLATSPGAITLTAPSALGNWVQIVGKALSATSLYFNPQAGVIL